MVIFFFLDIKSSLIDNTSSIPLSSTPSRHSSFSSKYTFNSFITSNDEEEKNSNQNLLNSVNLSTHSIYNNSSFYYTPNPNNDEDDIPNYQFNAPNIIEETNDTDTAKLLVNTDTNIGPDQFNTQFIDNSSSSADESSSGLENKSELNDFNTEITENTEKDNYYLLKSSTNSENSEIGSPNVDESKIFTFEEEVVTNPLLSLSSSGSILNKTFKDKITTFKSVSSSLQSVDSDYNEKEEEMELIKKIAKIGNYPLDKVVEALVYCNDDLNSTILYLQKHYSKTNRK